ncbi:MAG TPA: DEAD/DEAH box helicase [Thermoanaerobaculia bacterium]|nr:DEAD/DEAH box helicase [Thermoanaerobaculia bacterium]
MKKTPLDPSFAGLGLDARLVRALAALGYEEPTPIQSASIPPMLESRDVLAQAATGTGKTAAFALPILHRIGAAEKRGTAPMALVLVPTRELAMQLAEAFHRYGREIGVRVLPVYGGASMVAQLNALKRGVDVVVATPGRALDHVNRRSLALDGLVALVLDEADEMLDMGFAEDLDAILAATPKTRQTALFSATLPARIGAIAAKHLKDAVRITIAKDSVTPGKLPKVRQTAYVVARGHKRAALGRILDLESPAAALVFCRTRLEVDDLTESLKGRGMRVEALHGGISQEGRDRVMKKLRTGALELVVATDVAARGLDISHLSHVVNYDVPSSPEVYVHRIGRTGRAGREGVAITLAEPREHWQLKNIERLTKQRIEVANVPTVADLRAKRLELTRASLEEAIVEGGLEHYRVVVESLAEDHDPMDVAAAAVRLIERASGAPGEDEPEIPAVAVPPPSRRASPAAGAGPGRYKFGGRDSGTSARLFVGAGRAAGMRPADLVGAIANEAKANPRDIGAIQIADRFSLVEVPEAIAETVIRALRNATIRGQKVVVRRDRDKA